jgi:tRNA 2-selenouridine synthase
MLDVRSPSEFLQGHIPQSHSFPLFSDDERAQIGTVYKKQSRQEAVELGLWLVQPKLDDLFTKLLSLLTSRGKVLCWRGGMRSGFVARLIELQGFPIATLQGGYKAYRRWTLQKLATVSFPLLYILGGLTGSNKTAILQALQERGEQVLDLEALANHRGSAFGGIGLGSQPTQEQFENDLAMTIAKLDPSKPIWIEDESRLIGQRHLPKTLYESMIQAPLLYIHRPLTDRLKILLAQYGHAPKIQLLEAVGCIAKRLGSELTKEIRFFIENEQYEQAFEKLLVYYDKTYQYNIEKRQRVRVITRTDLSSPDEWAEACLHMK